MQPTTAAKKKISFNYDLPEGYGGNEMFWACLGPHDEQYINMFFNGANYNNADRVPLKMYYEKLVLYPDFDFKSCLELNCGTGDRIQMARELFLKNVFGCDDDDHREHWEEIGITPYCRLVDTNILPYQDNSFDFVITELRKYEEDKKKILKVLDETFRVGCGYIYLCGQYSEKLPIEWWTKQALDRHMMIEVRSRVYPNLVCVEGQMKWGHRNGQL